MLFPAATDAQFADAYAQTVAFALLLGRSIGADPLTLQNTQDALSARHNLLSRALQVFTDPQARTELATSLDLLLRVVGVVPPATLASPDLTVLGNDAVVDSLVVGAWAMLPCGDSGC